MSSVYVLEPPTKGKVVLNTTAGPLDIELWAKEAPKAVRYPNLRRYLFFRFVMHRSVASISVGFGARADFWQFGICQRWIRVFHAMLWIVVWGYQNFFLRCAM